MNKSEQRNNLYNTEAEQCVLGAMILNNDCVSMATKTLKEEEFFHKQHQEIFKAMCKLYSSRKPIDILTLSACLKDSNLLKFIGGLNYLTSLTTIVQRTANIEAYIDIVKSKCVQRKGVDVIEKIVDKLNKGDLEISNDLINLKSVIKNGKSIEDMLVKISDIKYADDSNSYMQTGFNKLDDWLCGGLKYGSLTVLTGIPGSGKSTLLNQVISNALSEGYKSFLFSGELEPNSLIKWIARTVSNDYHLTDKENMQGAKYKEVSQYGYELISEWLEDNLFIYSNDIVASERNLVTVIEDLYMKKDVRLFVLDNLMVIHPDSSGDQYEEQRKLVLNLKELAKKYGIAIVLVGHPKKTMEGAKPTMFDILGSSAIANVADTILRIERAKDEGDTSKLLLLKNRWGSVMNKGISMHFNIDRKRFYTDGSELIKDYGYDLNKKFVQAEISSPF